MLAIYKKELRSYFINPIGYVFLGVYLTFSALLCAYTTIQSSSYNTTTYFTMMVFVLAVFIPILTMRSFAEERKMKTEQLLLTSPVSVTSMVLGKFLSVLTVAGGSFLVSCINLLPLAISGAAARGGESYSMRHIGLVPSKVIGCIIGIVLISCVFVAIGLFISSLTENQLAAAIITVAIIVAMLFLNMINGSIENYAVRFVIDWVCFASRFAPFASGMFDPSAILYYLSVSAIFLLLTVRVYDKRRWA